MKFRDERNIRKAREIELREISGLREEDHQPYTYLVDKMAALPKKRVDYGLLKLSLGLGGIRAK